MAAAFIHGLILAFGLILPLGVQNVFVFNQGAYQKRFTQALPVVITASCCDTLLIFLAVYGISFAVLGSVWVKTILLGAGMLFLLYMGWMAWMSSSGHTDPKKTAAETFSRGKQIAFAASVSLLNPHAIMDTVGVIGTGSLSYTGADKAAFAMASVMVSWTWFTGLAVAGRLTGNLDGTGRIMEMLNKLSALVMWGAAVYIGFSWF